MSEHAPEFPAVAMEEVLTRMGLPADDENFLDTPSRWLKFLRHYMQEYDPKNDLKKAFTNGPQIEELEFNQAGERERLKFEHAMIVQTNIPYRAICAHHLLPVLGTAHVGYIPTKKVVGLSKLSRVVYGISHRLPSLQENVCNEIADALMEHLEALGSMCVISATHGCMECRGVEEPNVATVTSTVRGVFQEPTQRQEFYQLCQIQAHP